MIENKMIWCGNLSDQITEELLYELFLQAGPVERVKLLKDRDRGQKSYAFITYVHDVSVPYAMNLFRGTKLFKKTLTMQCRGRMAFLPPPIRCHGPDPILNISNEPGVVQQFANMTKNLHATENVINEPHKREDDQLVRASLQGHWSHRHHPYRAKEQAHIRENYRFQDQQHSRRNDNSGNWHDRRHNRRPYYNRRN